MTEIQDKYELILSSSRKLIEEIGFSALTMDKVAQKAGIAKGTVYLYFKDKDDLLEKVLSSGFEKMFERIKTRVGNESGAFNKLKSLINENLKHIYENRYFFKTIFLDEVNVVFLKKKSKESYNLRRKRYTDYIADIIKSGIESGEFRKDIDYSKTAYMLVALIKNGAIYNFLNGMFDLTPEMIEKDTEEILNLFMLGISVK